MMTPRCPLSEGMPPADCWLSVHPPDRSDDRTRFLETILSSVADGVFTVDRQWRITSFNRAAERITGVPAHKALGKQCSDVFHADICERGCAIRQTLESRRQIIDMPARILNRQGKSIPISLSTALLEDAEGALLGAVETFRDLSAIEQLRREIAHQYTFEDIVAKSEAFLRGSPASHRGIRIRLPHGAGHWRGEPRLFSSWAVCSNGRKPGIQRRVRIATKQAAAHSQPEVKSRR